MSVEPETIDIEPMEFKLAPEHRCYVYYTSIGALIIPTLVWAIPFVFGVWELEHSDRIVGISVAGTFVVAALFLCLWVNHYLLRVDSKGIHRRLLFAWKSWPWEDFAEGHILREWGTLAFTPLDSARERGGLLLAEFLADEDKGQVVELVDGVWHPPPMPDVPDKLHLRVRKGFLKRCDVVLTPTGIETDWTGRMSAYRWEEVSSISVERNSHYQQGFCLLRIALPGTEIRLRAVNDLALGARPNWKGGDAREVVAFLAKYLPQESFDIVSYTGPAQSLDDFQVRSADIHRRLRGVRIAIVVGAIVLTVLTAWLVYFVLMDSEMLREMPLPVKLAVLVPSFWALLPPVAVVLKGLYAGSVLRKRRREVEAERERFLEEHGAEAGDVER